MTDHRRHQVINDRSSRKAKLQRESPDSLVRAENAVGGTLQASEPAERNAGFPREHREDKEGPC
ncbi:hypothetical protein P3T21_000346 [Paraburkholderia sp. GAS334]